MFKKGEKVIYPKHGAGEISAITKEKIEEVKKKYYKIQFFNSPVSVSIPINKTKQLGLRYPLSRKALTDVLRNLNKIVKIDKKVLVTLDTVSKEKLGSGKMEDVVDLVNLLRSLAKEKEEKNKNFSYSYSDRLEIALDFIKSEVALVLGKNAPKRYHLP